MNETYLKNSDKASILLPISPISFATQSRGGAETQRRIGFFLNFSLHLCGLASLRLIIGLLAILLLTSCSESYLSVHTDYLSRENLASYHVDTPDPRLNNPPIGQRLIVIWSIPRSCFFYDDLHLEVTIRFRNREEIVDNYPIYKMHGTYVYSLLNEEYMDKQGMLSYKIDLVGEGVILEEWRHQIWADRIEIPHNENPPCDPKCDVEQEDEFSNE